MPIPLAATFLIPIGSQALGWVAGRFVDVDEPYEYFNRYMRGIRGEQVPGLLSPGEIRTIADQIVSYSPAGQEANSRGKLVQTDPSGDDSGRARQASAQRLARAFHRMIGESKVATQLQELENANFAARAMAAQGEQALRYKTSLASSAADRAWYDHVQDEKERLAVEQIVGQTTGLASMAIAASGLLSKSAAPSKETIEKGILGARIAGGNVSRLYGGLQRWQNILSPYGGSGGLMIGW